MTDSLRAEDLLPLIAKLPRDQRVRLARMALAAAGDDDRPAYVATPVTPGELGGYDASLAWDADGWDDLAPTW